MKKISLLAIIAIFAIAPAYSAKPATSNKVISKPTEIQRVKAPKFDLPDGARVMLEVNLNQDNLLGMFKQAIPSFLKGLNDSTGKTGSEKPTVELLSLVNKLDLNSLYASVQGVKALRVSNYEIKDKIDPSKLLNYFEKQLPSSKGWDRIYLDTQTIPQGTVAVYESNNNYAAFIIDPVNNQNFIVSTVGFIDIPKLTEWLGRTINYVKMTMDPGKDVELKFGHKFDDPNQKDESGK